MLYHQKRNLGIGLASYDRGNVMERSRLMRYADAKSAIQPQTGHLLPLRRHTRMLRLDMRYGDIC